jgi:tetratricopeptide (TPR) repeat protein
LNLKFNELVARYKNHGLKSVEPELQLLSDEAAKPAAPPALRYFVVDLLLDSKADKQALEILSMIEEDAGDKKLADAHYNLVAFAKWNLGDEDGAIDGYKLSLQLNSSSVSSLRGLCILLNEKGRNAEALPFAKRWIELAPLDKEAMEWSSAIRSNCK